MRVRGLYFETMPAPDVSARRVTGRLHLALLVVAVLLPSCLAVSRALAVPDAAHDAGVVRVVGLGWSGGLRALDALFAAPFLALPIGSRGFRGALASAAAAGLTGGLLYGIGRALLARLAEAKVLGPVLACVGSLATTLSIAWQLESSVAGGASVGALAALAPIAVIAGIACADEAARDRLYIARSPLLALTLGAAVGYDPVVGLGALLGVAAALVARSKRTPADDSVTPRRLRARIALGAGIGLLPSVIAFVRRASTTIETDARPFASWLGDAALGPASPVATSPVAFFHAQAGWLALLLAAAGLVIAFWSPRARATAAALAAVGMAGTAAVAAGAPASAPLFGAGALLALACLYLLAAVAMQALVRAIATARVPFASASAAMVVVLELAFPAIALDESAAACEARAAATYPGFDDTLMASLPPGSVLLLRDAVLVRHAMAARGLGTFRGDAALVPVGDLGGRAALRELSRDAALAPFFRDMALAGMPSEFALASLAGERPVVLEYRASWDRALARHLVAVGAFDRFEPEPRGVSDRRRALEAFLPARESLARALPPPRDPVLPAIVAAVLRARILGLMAAGERGLVPRAIDDLRAFEPADPIANELVRRLVTTKGAIDVKDLAR